ncbi:MAG: hypothetical protein Q8R57_07510 [Bacteroidota bacterium]|nr:hypothetical protein [Bacteroidota bacterium]
MEYDDDEDACASLFILNRLSKPIAERLDLEDVITIVNLEWEFVAAIKAEELASNSNLNKIEVNENDLEYYVIYNAVKHNILLSYSELKEIISLEFDYFKKNGLVRLGRKLGLKE